MLTIFLHLPHFLTNELSVMRKPLFTKPTNDSVDEEKSA